MEIIYYILSSIWIIAGILPFISNQHWIFRVWEFGRIQLFILHSLTLIFGLILVDEKDKFFWLVSLLNFTLSVYHAVVLFPYTTLYKKNPSNDVPKHSDSVSIISVNVYQFNESFQELIDLVKEVKPDVILTMESNQAWDDGMKVLEKDYPNFKKIPLENTYGMHFYTSLKVRDLKVNYFVADDLPSIEAELLTKDGNSFRLFGVHPPPPSPTEEDNSKERDGELLSIAKRVTEDDGPVVVVGDFNNVAWAKSSILFRKTSELIDPRIGRGFVSTFHAKYRLLRFPIDLFFHSTDVFIEEFKTLRNINSDHLPLYCKFYINKVESVQDEEVEVLEEEEHEEVEEMIEDGIEEESDRPVVAKE
ncbi:endonuclease/exonuclease/phosphatase family protein [Christiangramia sabulilitoris]|uniref:Endonuclease/exonuclease/phosphatase family protein n=2 Tax=Christiangramia sabulilitoris TaxID=2583991 RepID=A0A550I0M7_9FLAO|nr:endonuclease/exonuclease/phosphatase family protein [Christiangramia sabulilitoris]